MQGVYEGIWGGENDIIWWENVTSECKTFALLAAGDEVQFVEMLLKVRPISKVSEGKQATLWGVRSNKEQRLPTTMEKYGKVLRTVKVGIEAISGSMRASCSGFEGKMAIWRVDDLTTREEIKAMLVIAKEEKGKERMLESQRMLLWSETANWPKLQKMIQLWHEAQRLRLRHANGIQAL